MICVYVEPYILSDTIQDSFNLTQIMFTEYSFCPYLKLSRTRYNIKWIEHLMRKIRFYRPIVVVTSDEYLLESDFAIIGRYSKPELYTDRFIYVCKIYRSSQLFTMLPLFIHLGLHEDDILTKMYLSNVDAEVWINKTKIK